MELASQRMPEPLHRPQGGDSVEPLPIKVLTLNLHKGFSSFNRRDVLHEIRDAVRGVGADLVFLQEVVGETSGGSVSQYEFLADSLWHEHAYGRNAVSPAGHHGNALLSRFPITSWHNHDVSVYRVEPRGVLHCQIQLPGRPSPLHAICVHLGLREPERHRQLRVVQRLVREPLQRGEAVVLAGDFNDWRHVGHRGLIRQTPLREVHDASGHGLLRTFPARWPVLALDRIYVGNVRGQRPLLLQRRPWSHLSDHAPLASEVLL